MTARPMTTQMMRPFSSQTLLKLLALLSLVLALAAIFSWRQTGSASPWLSRGAIGAFAAALLVGLFDQETRPRLMLRFLAALFALIAIVALAADYSRAGGFAATSLIGHITELSPSLLAALRSATNKAAGPVAWESIVVPALSLPTFVIFGLLAVLAGYSGRPRDQVKIFIN